MRNMKYAEKGFTLVELSIVLVVIGLIIGSVLVAMNIIQNARTTSTVAALREVQSAFSTYLQNYSQVPGDDTNAFTRFSSAGVPADGGGDGVVGTTTLTKTYDTVLQTGGNGTGESGLVWSHLRASGLIKGAGDDTKQPVNAAGGKIGIQNGAFKTGGLTGNVVCTDNVPGISAQAIDQRLDDGLPDKGVMRGGTDITDDMATAYTTGTSYILCMGL